MSERTAPLPEETAPSPRSLWALTYPLIVGNLSAVALSVADGAVLGRFSTEAVAAVGLAAPVALVATMLVTGWATAVQVLAARHHGAGDRRAVEQLTDVGAVAGVVVGVIVAAALAILAPPLTRAMAGDTGLAGEAGLYLLIFAVGLPLAGAMGALRSALAGMGRTKATMRVAVVVNLVNIPIDVALVYGLGLGVAGAAAGTVLAQAAGAGGLAWYVWRHMPAGAGRKPIPRGWREELPRLWRIGWPETIMLTTGYLTTVLVAAIVAGLGVVDLAAWSILGRVLPVLWTVIYACSSGVAIAVGQRLGASDPAGTEAAIRSGWRVTGWLAAAIVTPVVLMPGLVFGLFTDDGAVVAAAVASRLYLFGQAPLMVATMVYSGALRAGGDTRSIMVAATVGNYLCALPASWVLAVPAGLGLNGVFLGQFGYWVLRLGITYRRYAAGGWRDPSPSHGQAG